MNYPNIFSSRPLPPFTSYVDTSLTLSSKTSTFVLANLLALTPLSNSKSSSAKLLPCGSGTLKYVYTIHRNAIAAQKNAVKFFQSHAVGLTIYGVSTLHTMPTMLYRLRPSTTVLICRRRGELGDE